MSLFTLHWGDIPDDPADRLTSSKIQEIVEKLKVFKKVPVEGEKLFQPVDTSGQTGKPQEISIKFDPVVLHTVSLVQDYRSMRKLFLTQQEKIKEGKARSSRPPPPPMPEFQECSLEHRKLGDLKDVRKDSDFTKGIGTSPPHISSKSVRYLMKKSVALMFCHIGFQSMTDVTLNIMTDVACDYFARVSRTLRKNADKEIITGHEIGSIDLLEKTLSDVGLKSMTVLHDFYQARVIRYHDELVSECKKIRNLYLKLGEEPSEDHIKKEPKDKTKNRKVKDTDKSEPLEFNLQESIQGAFLQPDINATSMSQPYTENTEVMKPLSPEPPSTGTDIQISHPMSPSNEISDNCSEIKAPEKKKMKQ